MIQRAILQEEPIPLRAHHLSAIGVLEDTPEEYGAALVDSPVGYVDRPDHPYVTKTFRFLDNLRNHPDQLVRITMGTQGDYICGECPLKAAVCPDFNPLSDKTPINHNPDRTDTKRARESNFEIGGVYTVRELLEKSADRIDYLKKWFF